MDYLKGLLTGFSKEVINLTGMFLAIAQLALVWYCLYILSFKPIQTASHDLILVVVTAILSKYSTMIDWFYGGAKKTPTTSDTTTATTPSTSTVTVTPTAPTEPTTGVTQ